MDWFHKPQVLLVFASPRHWGRSTGSVGLPSQETDPPRILFSFQREVQVKSCPFNRHADFSIPYQPKSLRHSFGGLLYLHHHLHAALQDGLGAGTCVEYIKLALMVDGGYLHELQILFQVARLVSPLPPQDQAQSNHATDCDDSMGYEYPFVLKAVTSGGNWCAW